MNRDIKSYLNSFLSQNKPSSTMGMPRLGDLSLKYASLLKCDGIPFYSFALSDFATEFDVSVEDIVTGGDGAFTRFEETVPQDSYCKTIVSNKAQTEEERSQLREIMTLGYFKEAAIPKYPYDTFPPRRYPYKYCLTDEFFETVAGDDRVSETAFDFLLQSSVTNQADGVWYAGYPYMIHWCFMHKNTERLLKLLDAAEKNNDDAVQKRDDLVRRQGPGRYGSGAIAFRLCDRFGLVRVLAPTILIAFERGDFDLGNRMIEINKQLQKNCNMSNGTNSLLYIPTEREIELAKIRGNKTMSRTDKMVLPCLYDGVLKVPDLLAKTSDYNIVKEAMEKYPITEREHIERMAEKKDWRGLYQYAFNFVNVMSGGPNTKIMDMAIEEDSDGYLREYGIWARSGQNNKRSTNYPSNFSGTPDEYRRKVLGDIALKNKLSETTETLTPEYFENQLNVGNYDMVIIKLCVRLESILKYKLGLEGEFSEMLDVYCKKLGDGDMPRLLNRLRMCRNAIVHPDQTSETLNTDELRKCVNYICKLG